MKTALLIILIALQIADAWTTILALKNPNNKEGNKYLRWLMEKVGVVPALLAGKGVVVALFVVAYLLAGDVVFMAVLAPIAIIYCWVVWNNWGNI